MPEQDKSAGLFGRRPSGTTRRRCYLGKDYEQMSLFDQIKAGIEDSIAYSRGQVTLKTTELPESPPQMARRPSLSSSPPRKDKI